MTDYGFIRVSTGSQDAATQERDIKRASASAVIVRTDTQAASASKGEQLDALDDVIAKLIPGDRIIVTDSSRLDRRENLDDQVATVLAIRATGAEIVSLQPGEETFGKGENLGNWISTLVKQSANAEKSRTVKEMTWRGVQAIIANSAWYGPLPPMWSVVGERFRKQAVCTDPDAVRAIYQAVRDGHSLSSLAREHDSYPQSIRKLVRTEANHTGKFECRYTHNGQTYTWQHAVTPVVDRELWHDANRVMTERGAIMDNTGGRPVALATSWISGILECPRCHGHLSVLRGKTLRCTGKGKNRHSCGIAGISLRYVIRQIDELIYGEDHAIYRYQRISGNQGELDELKGELDRLNATSITSIPRDKRAEYLERIASLEDSIAGFELVPETYDMRPTGETLASLWFNADSASRREILKSLHSRLGFSVDAGGYLDISEMMWPGETLVELTADICVKMTIPPRDVRDPWLPS